MFEQQVAVPGIGGFEIGVAPLKFQIGLAEGSARREVTEIGAGKAARDGSAQIGVTIEAVGQMQRGQDRQIIVGAPLIFQPTLTSTCPATVVFVCSSRTPPSSVTASLGFQVAMA